MKDASGFYLTPHFKQLLLLQAAGLLFVVTLGLVLYAGHDIVRNFIMIAVPIVGLLSFLVLMQKRLLLEMKNLFQHLCGSNMVNGIAFATLMMAMLVTAEGQGFDMQHLFFLSLFSALAGMLMARVWTMLTAQPSRP